MGSISSVWRWLIDVPYLGWIVIAILLYLAWDRCTNDRFVR